MKTIRVLQLGSGKQGGLNIEKMEILNEEMDVEIVGIADLQAEKAEPFLKYEVAKNARIYKNSIDAINAELPSGADVVFISTWTHQHDSDLEAICEVSDERNKPKAIGCEKPVFLDYKKGDVLFNKLGKKGIHLGEDFIELYSPTKQTSIGAIVDNNLEICSMNAIRGGPVKGKSIKREENLIKSGKTGTGGIYKNFDNSFDDKSVHDAGKIIVTAQKRYGRVTDATDIGAYFEKLEITNREGKKTYFTRDGKTSMNPAEANACYSNCRFSLDGIDCRLTGSWIDLKENDMKTLNSWFNNDIINAVGKGAKKDINPMPGKRAWDWETRAECIEARNKSGENVKVISSTFGDYFTVRQVEGGDAEVLQYGGGDFHLEYVKVLPPSKIETK